MSSAKSLKTLRSASVAFLEDGGSMLHDVDTLLQDIQRTLKNFEEREKALASREAYIQGLELQLQELMTTVQQQAAAISLSIPPAHEEPRVEKRQAETVPAPTPVSLSEATVQEEIAQLQDMVAVVTQAIKDNEQSQDEAPVLPKPLPSMMSAARNQRKKRRR
jgi:hypothetical protein